MSDEYPENYIDVLRFKAAMGWGEEHDILLNEVKKLEDMLKRVLSGLQCEIDMSHDSKARLNIDDDIKDWWRRRKEDDND